LNKIYISTILFRYWHELFARWNTYRYKY